MPSTDPYTFTAHGEPWVVRAGWSPCCTPSWSAGRGHRRVATAQRGHGRCRRRVELATSAPPTGLVPRLAVTLAVVTVGATQWAERPFMIGLIAFALTVLAAEGGLDPRWLVPVGWIWVNSHGSFPLGLVYLVAAGLGTQTRRRGVGPGAPDACEKWAALGMALGAGGRWGTLC